MQQRSFQYLTSLEDEAKKGLALQAVQNNPRLLTVPDYEYQRTKPSLEPPLIFVWFNDSMLPQQVLPPSFSISLFPRASLRSSLMCGG